MHTCTENCQQKQFALDANQFTFEVETQETLDEQVDWFGPPELDESWKDAWLDHARQICSQPHYEIDPATSEYKIAYFHPCNQYAKCAICAAKKKLQELNRLNRVKEKCENAKYIETTDEEAKKLIRKYGKDKVRRIALDDGSTGLVVDTEDKIGEELTDEIIKKLVENVITQEDGRRPSGNLGKIDLTPIDDRPYEEEKEPEPKEVKIDWTIPGDLDDPVKVICRKMIIGFDSDNPLAPRTASQLQYMAWSEVDIYETPKTKEELRGGVKKLENKWEEICQRYGMSFRFYSQSLNEVNLYDCDWKWTKNKLKIE